MPYITKERRDAVMEGDVRTPGELNYYLTMQSLEYIKEKGESYASYSDLFTHLRWCENSILRKNLLIDRDQMFELKQEGIGGFVEYMNNERKRDLRSGTYVQGFAPKLKITNALMVWSWSDKPYEALASIDMVRMELYRRKIAIYEDGKIAQNGDVF